MRKLIIVLSLLFTALITNGQNNVYKYAYSKDVVISKDSEILKEPWAGGFNNPQFQSLDVNFDCYDDLIIFERDGQEVRVYINDTLNKSYYYAPEYSKFFPAEISDWLVIKDYNADGKPDLFSMESPLINHGNGIRVYKNVSDTVLKFELTTAHLPAWDGSNLATVFVRAFDIPSFDDIDGDGDIDIVAQQQLYLTYQYYENRSTHPDTLDFHYNEKCWGQFFQNNNGTVIFNFNCKGGGSSGAGNPQRDGGYTLLTIDLNADGVKDAIIGDPDRSNMIMLNNAGTSTAAKMNTVNYQYPKPNSDSIKVTSFPAAFYLDVNHNGRSDLIVAPNQLKGSKDTGSVWFYDNFGAENLPNFQLAQKDFLAENHLDVGTMAIPVFADISGDNVPDLLIGNVGYFQNYDPSQFKVTYISQIAYYKNVGTPSHPKFEFVTNDLAGLSSRKLVRISPSFADIDGDGDNDLLFGELNGNINYYKNIAPIGSEANFVLEADSFMNINYGVHPSPFFFDIDKDNKLDLLVGQKNGNIKLFINQGTVNSALFDTAITDTLGGIFNYIPAYENNVIPYVGKINGDTNNVLVTTGAFGHVYFYSGLDGNYLSDYTRIDSMKLANGPIAPAFANLNTNDSLELVIGQKSGGLLLFTMDEDEYNYSPYPRDTCGHGEPASVNSLQSSSFGFDIYPNPNNGNFNIRFKTPISGSGTISIIDITGKMVYQKSINSIDKNQEIELNQSSLQQGIYIVSININDNYYRKKLIIQ